MTEEKLYRVAEIASMAGVERATVYTWMKENKLNGSKLGRRSIRISESEWQAFLRARNYQGMRNSRKNEQ